MKGIGILICVVTAAAGAQTGAPLQLTLVEALGRARQYGLQTQGAEITALIAREDRALARAATLPSVNAFNQFLYTEGNGTPSGVYVAANGVHVYTEQMVVHQELLSPLRRGELRRTQAAEASARARVEVARRGLQATVVNSYFTLAASQLRLTNARTSVQEAERFLDITQKQESGGEVAHADVIKAQLQLQQRQRDVVEAQLAIDKAKILLAVLVFPQFRDDFTVEDQFAGDEPLPALSEFQSQAVTQSPEVRAAQLSLLEAGYGLDIARYAYLPSLSVDFFYGLNSNQLAATTTDLVPATSSSTLPNYEIANRRNLGFGAQVTLNIPVWTWGATRSRIRQADLRRQQADLDIRLAQRQLQANIEAAYREAQVSRAQLDSLRSSADLAAESLRLTLLRYQAGESTALEVVDAQTTVATARNAYGDGIARYQAAAANLRILTGSL